MKLTDKERRVLAELAKPVGKRNYSKVHARTIHALQRKGLFGSNSNGKPGGAVTPAGRAELAVPDLFADLFQKDSSMKKLPTKGLPAKQALAAADKIVEAALSRDRASKRLMTLTNIEIDAHPLLDQDQRQTCMSLRNLAKKEGNGFTMLEFAEIALRATGNDYAAVTDRGGLQAAVNDAAHRRAAILYVYEAIKAGPPIIAETAGKRGTLRDLELLVSHL